MIIASGGTRADGGTRGPALEVEALPVWRGSAWLGSARALDSARAQEAGAEDAGRGRLPTGTATVVDSGRGEGQAAAGAALAAALGLRAEAIEPSSSGDPAAGVVVGGRGRRGGVSTPRFTTARPLPLSLTHRDAHGAAIVHGDPERRVGIDIERCGGVNPRFATCFASPWERERCPFGDPTVLWTLKEAAWKALRCPPAVPFRSLEIVWTDRGHLRGVRMHGREFPVQAMVLEPWPGWILSVLCLEDAS